MAELQDIKAFLTTVRLGSFSAAGRELGLSPSVMTKRVSRLEDRMGAPLLLRSTRNLSMTTLGEKVRPRFQLLMGELDEVLDGGMPIEGEIEGHLRIKTPQTITALYIGDIFAKFLAENRKVTMEIITKDRAVNPIEEGYDLAIGALPSSFANVEDVPLCRYDRVLCAAPCYLDLHGTPRTPGDLIEHECLTFIPAGTTWSFLSNSGSSIIDVHARMNANDSMSVLSAALQGVGVAILPRFLARPHLQSGALTELMPSNPVTPLSLKALIPANKRQNPCVDALVTCLIAELGPIPPWEQK